MLIRVLGSKIEAKSGREPTNDRNESYYISLNRIKYQLKFPIKKLKESYFSYLLDEVRTDILSGNKDLIQRHMFMIVSQCIYAGWSSKGLMILLKCLEGDATEEEKWTSFLESINKNDTTTFEVFYSIHLETRRGVTADHIRETISSLGFCARKGSEIITGNQESPFLCSKISPENSYVTLQVNAQDHHSAALCAINQLNSRISVATFYNLIDPWIACKPNIITFCRSQNTVEANAITDVFKTYDYVDSNNAVFSDTNAIFNCAEKTQIIERLSSAFSYTNLSRSSYFQETKYISLWIAIESLMRTGQYPDIISHIKNVLPEVLCIRYIYRIVRNFAEDCIRCGFKQDRQLDINMEQFDKKDLVRKLIAIFRDQNKYSALLALCSRNSLLSFRCEEIKQLLCEKTRIIKKFEDHITKVRRHIQRMYRIRNEIAHSAFKSDNSLVVYIEHLYTYLAQLMSEIVYYVEHKKAESIEEAFATITESYYAYAEVIKDDGTAIKDVLPDGIIEIP